MDNLSITFTETLSIKHLVFGIVLAAIVAAILTWHYRKFSRVISNKDTMSSVFFFIIPTMVLIISVVKSSLALSLGLVGALSIVRFRTPVKEPEDLLYLFLAIGVGLGIGANQTLPTLLAFGLIITVIAIVNWTLDSPRQKGVYISIEISGENEPGDIISKLNEILAPADTKRVEVRENGVFATFLMEALKDDDIVTLTNAVKKQYKNANVTFIDSSNELNW